MANKTKTTSAGRTMSMTRYAATAKVCPAVPVTSMTYRPRDYCVDDDLQAQLLTRVKGTVRRNAVRQALETGQIDDLPETLQAACLSDAVRQYAGSVHPSFMGGEYLQTAYGPEVEIARIRIRSTTGDVVSVYARLVGRRYAYRVVDEYEGDTLSARTRRTSMQPLTMGQLIAYFLGAWDLYCCLEANFEVDVTGMLRFFRGESEFYPCFDDALRELVRQRFAT